MSKFLWAPIFLVASTVLAFAEVVSVKVDVPKGTPTDLDIRVYAAKTPETPVGPLIETTAEYSAEIEMPNGLKIVCARVISAGWIFSYPELPDRATDACVDVNQMKKKDGVGIIPFGDLKQTGY